MEVHVFKVTNAGIRYGGVEQVQQPSPIAAEARRGIVIEATARRVEPKPCA